MSLVTWMRPVHPAASQINQKLQPPATPETTEEQFITIIQKSIPRIPEIAIGHGREEGKKLSLDSDRLPVVRRLANNIISTATKGRQLQEPVAPPALHALCISFPLFNQKGKEKQTKT